MPIRVSRVEYFYTTVGEGAHDLLASLAGLGVNLLALHTVPIGPDSTQLTLFPEDSRKLQSVAQQARLALDGPHAAILVQGDDQMGALAGIHQKLRRANVSVFASMAVTDGRGFYGYVIYLRPGDTQVAMKALEL